MKWNFTPFTRWERIKYWSIDVKDWMVNFPSRFFNKLRRTLAYLPIIWNDYDFAAEPGIYTLLRKKLELLEPQLRHGHCLYGSKYANEVFMAIRLLDRIINDDYRVEPLKAHEAKWGECEVVTEPTDDGKMVVYKFNNYPNAHTPQQQEEADKEMREVHKKAEEIRQRDINYLFNHLAKKIGHWWD